MEAKVTRGHRKGKDAKGPGECLEVQGMVGRTSPARGVTAGARGQGGDTERDSADASSDHNGFPRLNPAVSES